MKTKYLFLTIFACLSFFGCNKNDDGPAVKLPELQNEPPLSFNLIDVADNSTNVGVLPTLSWESAKNPEGSDVTYDLYLGNEVNPKTIYQNDIAETSFQIEERLSLITKYYWKVVATDTKGTSSQSNIQEFTTRNLTIPDAPFVANANFGSRSNHTTTFFDNKLWIIGGFYVEETRDDAWFGLNGIDWTKSAENEPFCDRSGHSAVVFQDEMYIIGGFVDENPLILDDVWQSNNGVDWEDVTPNEEFPERGNHSSVVFDNKIWIIGGSSFKGFKYDDIWSSTNGRTWTEVAIVSPSFSGRTGHASAVFNNKIWIVGGQDDDGLLNDVWSSSDGKNWELANLNAAFSKRRSHTLTIHDGKMWLIGGSGGDGLKNDVWYSSDGVEWTELPVPENFPTRTRHTAISYDNKLLIIGGYLSVDDLEPSDDIWALE